MAQENPPHGRRDDSPTGDSFSDGPRGDPWSAFGYVVAGVFLYGFIGWLFDRWLGTSFLVAVGILIGAGLGIYQTWAHFRIPAEGTGQEPRADGKQT